MDDERLWHGLLYLDGHARLARHYRDYLVHRDPDPGHPGRLYDRALRRRGNFRPVLALCGRGLDFALYAGVPDAPGLARGGEDGGAFVADRLWFVVGQKEIEHGE